MLSCSLAFSQEADDDTVTGVGFSLIPRLDISPAFPLRSVKDLTLGNTSLYSLFEGSFLDESLTFSICNHWLSTSPADLYIYEDEEGNFRPNFFYTDTNNWLDWAYLSYSVAGFEIQAGKSYLLTGGFAFDADDYDLHPVLESSLWNNFSPYQWGVTVGYTLPSENHSFAFQFATSPYGTRPFVSKLFSYSLEWRGTFGDYSTRLTATALQTDCKEYIPLLSWGNRYDFDHGHVGLDLYNCVVNNTDYETSVWGIAAMPEVFYDVTPRLEIFAKGGFEYDFNAEDRQPGWFGGLGLHWYPLQDRSLRLHLLAAYNDNPYSPLLNWDGEQRKFTISFGALYYLNFGILK